MNKAAKFSLLLAAPLVFAASQAAAVAIQAPAPVAAPAPLPGAGLPGLAVFSLAGVGYLAVRMRRRRPMKV
jgi:hypothetical protein